MQKAITMSPRETWNPSPAGELSQLQQSLKARAQKLRSRRRFLLVGGGATAVAAGGTLFVLTVGNHQPGPDKLTCAEAVEMMPGYLDGTLADSQARHSLEVHLDRCPKCARHLDQIRSLG